MKKIKIIIVGIAILLGMNSSINAQKYPYDYQYDYEYYYDYNIPFLEVITDIEEDIPSLKQNIDQLNRWRLDEKETEIANYRHNISQNKIIKNIIKNITLQQDIMYILWFVVIFSFIILSIGIIYLIKKVSSLKEKVSSIDKELNLLKNYSLNV